VHASLILTEFVLAPALLYTSSGGGSLVGARRRAARAPGWLPFALDTCNIRSPLFLGLPAVMQNLPIVEQDEDNRVNDETGRASSGRCLARRLPGNFNICMFHSVHPVARELNGGDP
jgi:hypothetical protein